MVGFWDLFCCTFACNLFERLSEWTDWLNNFGSKESWWLERRSQLVLIMIMVYKVLTHWHFGCWNVYEGLLWPVEILDETIHHILLSIETMFMNFVDFHWKLLNSFDKRFFFSSDAYWYLGAMHVIVFCLSRLTIGSCWELLKEFYTSVNWLDVVNHRIECVVTFLGLIFCVIFAYFIS